MMEIMSRDNATFKNLLKLCDKKHRRATGLCIIEGEKIVREHLNTAKQVFVRSGSRFTEERLNTNADVFVLADKLFDLVSDLQNGAGVLATVAIPAARAVTFPYLVLDGVQDAGNMGTILRTAAAFGYRTVFCIDCVDVWGQKVLRASSGIQFGLNIIENNMNDFVVPPGTTLVGADLDGADISVAGGGIMESDNNGAAAMGNFGLVLGSEGQGIRSQIKAMLNQTVTIPMDAGCESLNVAVAGAILMFELWGKRKN